MNSGLGTVKEIVYANSDGPRGPNGPRQHPAYVVVDFPDCKIPEEKKLIPGKPRTYVPVPPKTLRCEKGCCSATQIPLRVCKACSCHKCQGMSVGEGHAWSKVVVGLPSRGNRTPGLEQVSISRATCRAALAIDDSEEPITYDQLMRIGKGKAYDKRREFEEWIATLAAESQAAWRQRIMDCDPNRESPSFEGGFDAVVRRYRDFLARTS
jgi:hypothetical protein